MGKSVSSSDERKEMNKKAHPHPRVGRSLALMGENLVSRIALRRWEGRERRWEERRDRSRKSRSGGRRWKRVSSTRLDSTPNAACSSSSMASIPLKAHHEGKEGSEDELTR